MATVDAYGRKKGDPFYGHDKGAEKSSKAGRIMAKYRARKKRSSLTDALMAPKFTLIRSFSAERRDEVPTHGTRGVTSARSGRIRPGTSGSGYAPGRFRG